VAATLGSAGRRDSNAARRPHRRGARSGAPRTTPAADDLAARQGRRQARGPCVAPPRRRSASPQVGIPRSRGVPGAGRATLLRSGGQAGARRRAPLPPPPVAARSWGILRGFPLGTAPQCQGTRTAPGRCLREAATSPLPLRHKVDGVPLPYRCTYSATRQRTGRGRSRRRFNPHPARRPSATWRRAGRHRPQRDVSILTRPEGRVLQSTPGYPDLTMVFQSSPGPKAECYSGACCGYSRISAFQSSPGPKAECYPDCRSRSSVRVRFNPHPARRPSATRLPGLAVVARDVSILTRPEGRVLRLDLIVCGAAHLRVSILTRPEGRVLPAWTLGTGHAAQFQSSPGPKAECYATVTAAPLLATTFQSSPGPKAECYRCRHGHDLDGGAVSILTRPEGRVLPYPRPFCYGEALRVSILTRPEGRVLLVRCDHQERLLRRVSILTRPEGRVLRDRERRRHVVDIGVSILTRPEGRVLPLPSRSRPGWWCCFNPHPARRPSATATLAR